MSRWTLLLQGERIAQVLEWFHMSWAKFLRCYADSDLPHSIGDGLIDTMLDILYAMGVVNRFTLDLKRKLCEVVKGFLWYLSSTRSGLSGSSWVYGLGVRLLCSQLRSEYIVKFAGGAVTWSSRLQECIVVSAMEVEYATSEAGKEASWLSYLVTEMGATHKKPGFLQCQLQCDPIGVELSLPYTGKEHQCAKSIHMRLHWEEMWATGTHWA